MADNDSTTKPGNPREERERVSLPGLKVERIKNKDTGEERAYVSILGMTVEPDNHKSRHDAVQRDNHERKESDRHWRRKARFYNGAYGRLRSGAEPNSLVTFGSIVLLAGGLLVTLWTVGWTQWIWPVMTAALMAAPLLEFCGRLTVAVLSGFYTLLSFFTFHGDGMTRRTRRKIMAQEAGHDWKRAGLMLGHALHQGSRPWGFGTLLLYIGHRLRSMRARSKASANLAGDPSQTPPDFRERYHVIRELPSGGSHARLYVVRRAGDHDEGEKFVLKHFDIATGAHLEIVTREKQAVELARRLGLIVDSEIGPKSFYYVMPFYAGEQLTPVVMREVHALPAGKQASARYQRQALGWAHQLLQIASQYHDAGVIHKDIKPDNLIVDAERLYLVDIGLMTPLASMQQLTTHGTEYFRDPELVRMAMAGQAPRDVNAAKFDIYAIGAVLYFLFEGDIPGMGSLSSFSREVPPAVRIVVSRAMAAFERRYESARAMLADVDYLCWAASQGELEHVRAADLPSCRAQADHADGDIRPPSWHPPVYAQPSTDDTSASQ